MGCCAPKDGSDNTGSCGSGGCGTGKALCKLIMVLILALTPVWLGYLLRDGLRDFQGERRAVSVRGLSEREVKSDLAAWPFMLSTTNNDLALAQTELKRQETELREFLKAQGLDLAELTTLRYEAQDLLAQSYRPDGIDQGRYVLSKTLLLRTTKVDAVEAASQAIDSLIAKNVALGSGSTPSFVFTRLNDVKPEMIKEATANAFQAAEQFAQDSGAKVGAIVDASQGVFSIEGRDELSSLAADGQLNKKVRVVTSVRYRLND